MRDYDSGGRNPNIEETCVFPKQCKFLNRTGRRDGGWCYHPSNILPPTPEHPDGYQPSVSSTGGCSKKEVMDDED
jgi:hypothetical protein